MRNVFEYLVNTGMEQLDLIADAEKKATICAELAKAIAQSGLLSGAVEEVEVKEAKKETKKSSKKTKKDALKPEASKTENATTSVEEVEQVEEEVIETPQEPVVETEEAPQEPVMEQETTQEVEMVDEWTDEMCELKAEQLELLNAYCEAWGEDYVYNDCLGAFSEGAFVGGENVRPSNIDGFVVYLQELNSQFSQE